MGDSPKVRDLACYLSTFSLSVTTNLCHSHTIHTSN